MVAGDDDHLGLERGNPRDKRVDFLDRGHLAVEVSSAPATLNPCAVAVLAELDVDISAQVSKGVADVPVERVGTAITLCADEVCPVLPGEVRRLHWPIEDPAGAGETPGAELMAFRKARDEIKERLKAFFDAAGGSRPRSRADSS